MRIIEILRDVIFLLKSVFKVVWMKFCIDFCIIVDYLLFDKMF